MIILASQSPRRADLLEQVWGYRHAGDTRLVNVHVQRLRSKIERDPEHPEVPIHAADSGDPTWRSWTSRPCWS